MREHDNNFIFDTKYPPDETLPLSDEYSDESQVGYYGRSAHDRAIVHAANPLCVWSMVEGDYGLYAVAGFRVVNWQNWYISSVPRNPVGGDDFEEYCLLEDEPSEDDD